MGQTPKAVGDPALYHLQTNKDTTKKDKKGCNEQKQLYSPILLPQHLSMLQLLLAVSKTKRPSDHMHHNKSVLFF